jgi:hypothetical protein
LFAALAVAGCTSGGGGTTQQPATNSSRSASSDATGIWREFVACARTNGQQNMPDAVVAADGHATFPQVDGFNEKTAFDAVKGSCGAILDRLPPGTNPLAAPSMTPEQLEQMRRYVRCLRDNGMPDMPDPGPNGEIRDPDRYREPPLADVRNQARTVCDPILLER